MKILIYNSGEGLGDSIMLFDLILSLNKRFSSREIYYLSSHKNHFDNALQDYNLNMKEFKTNISFYGFRLWHVFASKNKILKNNNIKKFDLIIDLQSSFRNTLILKQFPSNNFYSSTYNFKFCNLKKNYISTKYKKENIVSNLEKLLDIKIPYEKYNIKLIDKTFFDQAKKLLPDKNYIGFAVTHGSKYRKKSWPLKRFINVANKIAKKNKKPVFFIKKEEKELIYKIKNEVNNALFPELETTLSGPALVSALSTRLEKAISIDCGIMHMIGLANIPMIVLFGPTNSNKFAPKLKKIDILDSKLIYNSENIHKITENDVLSLI